MTHVGIIFVLAGLNINMQFIFMFFGVMLMWGLVGEDNVWFLWLTKAIIQQEAFRERRHLHVCDLWPWVVTLTLSQGQISLCNSMSLIVLYLGSRYDVCECNSLWDMSISTFLWPLTFACDLHRPSRSLSFLLLDGRYIVV